MTFNIWMNSESDGTNENDANCDSCAWRWQHHLRRDAVTQTGFAGLNVQRCYSGRNAYNLLLAKDFGNAALASRAKAAANTATEVRKLFFFMLPLLFLKYFRSYSRTATVNTSEQMGGFVSFFGRPLYFTSFYSSAYWT